jgi:anti-sigma-K factor RskA
MTREADLVTRAGSYVLGMMEESDRQRAERDLEIDPAFRDAVLRVAERMHLLDLNPTDATQSDF